MTEAEDYNLYRLREGKPILVRRWFVEVLGCPRCGEPLTPRTLGWGEGDDRDELWAICRQCSSAADRVATTGRAIPDSDPREAT